MPLVRTPEEIAAIEEVLRHSHFVNARATVRVHLEGPGPVRLAGTVRDPLDEIEVVDVRRAAYVEGDVEVRSRALARIPGQLFLPYAYGRLDYWPALATA
jgi:hypothetical protein